MNADSAYSRRDFADLGDDQIGRAFDRAAPRKVDLAMRDAFRKARRFLMTSLSLSGDEAISLFLVGVDLGVTQVVNGRWGVRAVIRKSLFTT